MKIFLTVLMLYSGQIFITKISKGHNSVKNVGGVRILLLCTSPDNDLYLYKNS